MCLCFKNDLSSSRKPRQLIHFGSSGRLCWASRRFFGTSLLWCFLFFFLKNNNTKPTKEICSYLKKQKAFDLTSDYRGDYFYHSSCCLLVWGLLQK